MIIKERNSAEHPQTDKFSEAGAAAEEKMAFYLRRMFLNDPDIYVFNDVRYKDDTGDVAQIDHLILHRHGFIIIESKSVSTQVSINNQGEWSRQWNGKWEGMQSPVQQAKLQAEFLRRALGANAEELIAKKWYELAQPMFRQCPFEVIVAISDHGSVKRKIEMAEVVKADQVPDKARSICERHKKAASLLNITSSFDDGLYSFTDDEMKKLSHFLTTHHYPVTVTKSKAVRETPPNAFPTASAPAAKPPASAPPDPPAGLGICEKCGAQSIIKWGKFGYYWKCLTCDSNMPLKEYCPTCHKKLLLRKDKNRFFIRCELCGGERLYCEFETASD